MLPLRCDSLLEKLWLHVYYCRLKPFHVKLMGVRRGPWGTTPLEAELQQKGVFQDLHSLVGQADLIVLTCSLTDATRGMVDRAFLATCKPGVRIINVARGMLAVVNNTQFVPHPNLGVSQFLAG